jgi:hypothetical protein
MTTATITLRSICAGGNHLTFGVTVDGQQEMRRVIDLAHAQEPLTEDDAQAFLKIVAKMAMRGRTINQARTLLQAGVTVVV